MDALWKHIAQSCLVLLFLLAAGQSTTKMKEKCGTCRDITEAFAKGIKRTEKSNFGGGNTRWEENSLGSWRFSETRFVDIQEKLCDDISEEKKSKKDKAKSYTQCHAMVEEHEEDLESWWFNDFKKGTEKFLYDHLCLEKMKVCCENGTYGADCSPCPGGKDKPCNAHGDCDGISTRGGTGRCLCHAEYAGDQCTECREGYYEKEKNDTYLECADCHVSCKNCTAGGPRDCITCREGYNQTEEGCIDFDECSVQPTPCKDNEYCSNTVGSFLCMACNAACDRCLGDGDDKCVKCKDGYEMKEGRCEDIDECEEDATLCQADQQYCVNKPGSYNCACKKGYELVGSQCVPKSMLDNNEKKKQTKKKQKKSKGLYDEAPPHTDIIYGGVLVLFCITGKLLKGHVPGSMLLCIAMGFMFFRMGSYYG
ncbi:cysteine-rich with EGF-like domain protein 2 isoform X2 [Lineus longissimus]|uniref:cysteine-rich with EGF-like domain protein 2 isoform X2 n=1 Tax=Lineus longissimus TaxID=88925 RepID=UPI00315D2832